MSSKAQLMMNDGSSSPSTNYSGAIVNTAGIYVSFVLLSFMQEKITRTKYDNQRFNYILFLMFCQSIGNTVYSGIRIYWERNQKTPTQNNLQTSILPNTNFSKPSPIDSPQPKHSSTVPLSIYALASLTYILAFYCSNLALLYVNYPTQVFGKSCKCVPVLVMGILFLKKKYPFTRYVSVFLVSFGISLFMLEKMNGKPEVSSSGDSEFHIFGVFLVFLSLMLDGVTSMLQDVITDKSRYKRTPSGLEIMFYSNLFAILYISVSLIFFSQETAPALKFCAEHPQIIFDIAIFCICQAVGQTFIYNIVVVSGPLVCSIITTTRKFFSIVFSTLWFGHFISPLQWFSIVIVFLSLIFDAFMSYWNNQKKKQKLEKTLL